ncbi:MAG TPA: Xaa-Pro peptidase family protein, partial [Vicinamibacterales bacterium]|nr:Xaa-Pro peptidase family protein [Vicinamibacterales bacterium]
MSTRREFLKRSAAATAGISALAAARVRDAEAQSAANVPESIRALKPMMAGVVAITSAERAARLEKARRLMTDNRIAAIVLEGGSSMFYFAGVRWGLSERPFVTVIPAKGDPAWVSPGFEEARARELIEVGGRDLRTWQEDESPYRLVAQILRDRGISTGSVGIEERLRFFVFNGIRKEAPAIDYVSADAVTAGCRMIKSPAEIALMQRANDITIAAYEAAFAALREGMTQGDLRANIMAAYRALGATTADVAVSFGEYTAFPHGSITPQKLKEGDVVQVDDGCSVEGYQSDITRTTVFGKATKRQTDVW